MEVWRFELIPAPHTRTIYMGVEFFFVLSKFLAFLFCSHFTEQQQEEGSKRRRNRCQNLEEPLSKSQTKTGDWTFGSFPNTLYYSLSLSLSVLPALALLKTLLCSEEEKEKNEFDAAS